MESTNGIEVKLGL